MEDVCLVGDKGDNNVLVRVASDVLEPVLAVLEAVEVREVVHKHGTVGAPVVSSSD